MEKELDRQGRPSGYRRHAVLAELEWLLPVRFPCVGRSPQDPKDDELDTQSLCHIPLARVVGWIENETYTQALPNRFNSVNARLVFQRRYDSKDSSDHTEDGVRKGGIDDKRESASEVVGLGLAQRLPVPLLVMNEPHTDENAEHEVREGGNGDPVPIESSQ